MVRGLADVEEGGVNVRPRMAAERWWVRKAMEGVSGKVELGGGERRDVREERRAVFWVRVARRARFILRVSWRRTRRARRDSRVGAVG